MTTITMADDTTRRALRFAIWTRVATALRDGTYEFDDLAREALTQGTGEIGEKTAMVIDAARDAQRIADAPTGEEITLSIPRDELIAGLDECVSCLREDDAFWDAPPEKRRGHMWTFDSANRLLRDLGPAEAVAS